MSMPLTKFESNWGAFAKLFMSDGLIFHENTHMIPTIRCEKFSQSQSQWQSQQRTHTLTNKLSTNNKCDTNYQLYVSALRTDCSGGFFCWFYYIKRYYLNIFATEAFQIKYMSLFSQTVSSVPVLCETKYSTPKQCFALKHITNMVPNNVQIVINEMPIYAF